MDRRPDSGGGSVDNAKEHAFLSQTPFVPRRGLTQMFSPIALIAYVSNRHNAFCTGDIGDPRRLFGRVAGLYADAGLVWGEGADLFHEVEASEGRRRHRRHRGCETRRSFVVGTFRPRTWRTVLSFRMHDIEQRRVHDEGFPGHRPDRVEPRASEALETGSASVVERVAGLGTGSS